VKPRLGNRSQGKERSREKGMYPRRRGFRLVDYQGKQRSLCGRNQTSTFDTREELNRTMKSTIQSI
jgi:hypothetical protein